MTQAESGPICAICDRPSAHEVNFAGRRYNGRTMGRERLCYDCLCSLMEGATIGDLASRILKRRRQW